MQWQAFQVEPGGPRAQPHIIFPQTFSDETCSSSGYVLPCLPRQNLLHLLRLHVRYRDRLTIEGSGCAERRYPREKKRTRKRKK